MTLYQEWVLDRNSEKNDQDISVLDLLISNDFENIHQLYESELPNGLTLTKCKITDPRYSSYSAIQKYISKLSIDPIVITLPLQSVLDDPEINVDEINLEGVNESIKRSIKKILGIDVDHTQSNMFEDVIQLIPYNINLCRIYCSQEKLGEIIIDCDLEKIMDFRYITATPYMKYLVETEQMQDFNNSQMIVHNKGIMVEDNLPNYQLDDLKILEKKYNNDEHYVLGKVECKIIDSLELWSEIAELWNFEIVDYGRSYIVVKKNHKCPINHVKYFFHDAKHNIKTGDLIDITFRGHWQLWTKDKKPYIVYAAHRAYSEDNYAFISSLKVNDDFSVTVKLGNYQEYYNFKNKLHNYLTQINDWSVVYCVDIIDAIIKRYELNNYNDNKNLILNIDDNYYIVSDVNLDNFTFVGKRTELEERLRSYFSKCEVIYNSEGSVTTLEQSSLDDLLKLVYTNGKIVYCFDVNILDEILNRGLPLEPVLLTNDNISRYENLENALTGYFDFGPLKGLYQYLPSRMVNVPEGFIEVSFIERYDSSASPVIDVDFTSQDGGTRNLFKIASEKLFEVKELVEFLWRTGWFLSDWGISYYNYTGRLSMNLIRNIPFLQTASDTIERGNFAFNIMKRMVQNYMDNYSMYREIDLGYDVSDYERVRNVLEDANKENLLEEKDYIEEGEDYIVEEEEEEYDREPMEESMIREIEYLE